MSKMVSVKPKTKGVLLINVVNPSNNSKSLQEYSAETTYQVTEEFYSANKEYFVVASDKPKKFSTDGKIGDHEKRALKRHLKNMTLGELLEEGKRVNIVLDTDRDSLVEKIFSKRVKSGDVSIQRMKFPPIEEIVKKHKQAEVKTKSK